MANQSSKSDKNTKKRIAARAARRSRHGPGCRTRRQDTIVRKATSWVGRTTRRLILGDTIRDTGCTTRVMRTDIARQFPLQFKGMHRFMPVYAQMVGARSSRCR